MTTRAKVAAVIDSHTAAINAGAKQGVLDGDLVTVLGIQQIVDPDTNVVLGNVEIQLVRLRVGSVSEGFCLANTFEPVNTDDILAMFSGNRTAVQQITDAKVTAQGYVTVVVGMPVRIDHSKAAPTPPRPPARRPATPAEP